MIGAAEGMPLAAAETEGGGGGVRRRYKKRPQPQPTRPLRQQQNMDWQVDWGADAILI